MTCDSRENPMESMTYNSFNINNLQNPRLQGWFKKSPKDIGFLRIQDESQTNKKTTHFWVAR
jgi:hypothetical protein